jgi:hypothetical protein
MNRGNTNEINTLRFPVKTYKCNKLNKLCVFMHQSPAQVEQFAARHRVIAVSLRHHYPNASTGDLADYGPRVHAADVAALVQTLAVGPVHLVGQALLRRGSADFIRARRYYCMPSL